MNSNGSVNKEEIKSPGPTRKKRLHYSYQVPEKRLSDNHPASTRIPRPEVGRKRDARSTSTSPQREKRPREIEEVRVVNDKPSSNPKANRGSKTVEWADLGNAGTTDEKPVRDSSTSEIKKTSQAYDRERRRSRRHSKKVEDKSAVNSARASRTIEKDKHADREIEKEKTSPKDVEQPKSQRDKDKKRENDKEGRERDKDTERKDKRTEIEIQREESKDRNIKEKNTNKEAREKDKDSERKDKRSERNETDETKGKEQKKNEKKKAIPLNQPLSNQKKGE